MEALTGVSVALLTIYDMCKAIDKRMEIGEIHLDGKSGGRAGNLCDDRRIRQNDRLRPDLRDRSMQPALCVLYAGGSVGSISHEEILRFGEIERVCQILAENGIQKIKLTGGEPLVRRRLPEFYGWSHLQGIAPIPVFRRCARRIDVTRGICPRYMSGISRVVAPPPCLYVVRVALV